MKAGVFIIANEKIGGYLLDPAHPHGAGKCALFLRHGFSSGRPSELTSSLLRHAIENGVERKRFSLETTPYGLKSVVTGPLNAPSGRNPNAISVWDIVGDDPPTYRFITAYIRPA